VEILYCVVFWLRIIPCCQARTTGSHYRRDTDPHGRKNANELAANHGCGCQQELSPALIRFAQDWIAVIEGVEKLRQLEGMLGKISRFGGRDALTHDIRGFRGRQPQLPDVVAGFAIEEVRETFCRDEAWLVSSRTGVARGQRDAASRVSPETLGIESTFAENVGSADDGILRIRACVTLETQGVFEIEGDHL